MAPSPALLPARASRNGAPPSLQRTDTEALAFPLAPTVSVRREIGELRDAPGSTPWPRFELAAVLRPGESRGGAFQGAAYGGDEADKSMAIIPT